MHSTGFKALLKRKLKKSFGEEINHFKSVRLEVGSLLIILIGAFIYFTCANGHDCTPCKREKLLLNIRVNKTQHGGLK